MKFADKLFQVCQRILGLKKERPSPQLRRHRPLGVEPLGERIMLAGDIDLSYLNLAAETVQVANGGTANFLTTASSFQFNLANTAASDDLDVSGVAYSGDITSVSLTPPTIITPGGSTSFTVGFDGASSGSFTGAVTITSDDPDEDPFTFTIIRQTPPPDIAVRFLHLDATLQSISDEGTIDIDSPDTSLVFALHNEATDGVLLINGWSTGGQITSMSPASLTVSPQSSTTSTVDFDATSSGPYFAWVEISSNDPDEDPFRFYINLTNSLGSTSGSMQLHFEDGTIDEHSPVGAYVATVTANPADTSPFVYALTDDSNGAFQIDSATGIITVADSSLLDYELNPYLQIQVKVTDTNGDEYEDYFWVMLNDTGPTSLTLDNDSVEEFAENATVVGTIIPEGGTPNYTFNFAMDDFGNPMDADGRFAIDANLGVILVADGLRLNYEDAPTHSIRVVVTDANGGTYEKDFTIAVNEHICGRPLNVFVGDECAVAKSMEVTLVVYYKTAGSGERQEYSTNFIANLTNLTIDTIRDGLVDEIIDVLVDLATGVANAAQLFTKLSMPTSNLTDLEIVEIGVTFSAEVSGDLYTWTDPGSEPARWVKNPGTFTTNPFVIGQKNLNFTNQYGNLNVVDDFATLFNEVKSLFNQAKTVAQSITASTIESGVNASLGTIKTVLDGP